MRFLLPFLFLGFSCSLAADDGRVYDYFSAHGAAKEPTAKAMDAGLEVLEQIEAAASGAATRARRTR